MNSCFHCFWRFKDGVVLEGEQLGRGVDFEQAGHGVNLLQNAHHTLWNVITPVSDQHDKKFSDDTQGEELSCVQDLRKPQQSSRLSLHSETLCPSNIEKCSHE